MRTVVVLAIIAAGLAAFIVFVDRRHPSGNDQAAHVRLLPAVDRAAVRRITIARGDQRPFGLVREPVGRDPAWRVGTGPADDHAVEDLLGALDLAESDRAATIDLDAAGLKPPAVRLEIETPAATTTVALGRPDPTGQGVYAQVSGADAIRVAPRRLLALADRPSEAFRDHRLFPFSAPSISAIAWAAPDGHAGKISRHEGRWMIPTGPAMSERVDDALRGLLALRIDSFGDEIPELHTTSFITVDGPARVVASVARDGEETVVLRDGPEARQSVQVSGAALAALWPALARAAARDTRLLASPPDTVTQVELLDGPRRLAMRREHGAWIFTAPHVAYAADPQLVDAWLARLHTTEVGEGGRGPGRHLVIEGRFHEEADVRATAGDAYALLDPDLFRFRDRRVLSFARFDVRRLRRQEKGDAPPVEVATRDADLWVVIAPPGADVDGTNLSRIVSALDDLRATAFRTKPPSGAPALHLDIDVQPPGEPRTVAYALALYDAPAGACVGWLDAETIFDIAPAACTELRLPVLAGGH
jgi:hypothetical protein